MVIWEFLSRIIVIEEQQGKDVNILVIIVMFITLISALLLVDSVIDLEEIVKHI
jgi:hypothetical protein